MSDKSIEKTNKTGFRSLIPEYSDEKIVEILKKRKQYQPEAADLAIREAIKRGLINSEQDLFSEKFNGEPLKFSLFPPITNEKNRNDIRISIARIFLLVGMGPIIWGVLEIMKSVLVEGVLLIFLGAVWVFASVKLMRSLQTNWVNLLLLLVVAFAAYIVKILAEMKGLTVMDIAIPVLLFLFLIYGLLFIRRMK